MTTLVLARNVAMDAINFTTKFTPGEAAISSYALKQFTAVGASATLANGAGTDSKALIVDDETALTVGNYYQIGSADPVRIDWTSPLTHTAYLHEVRTWSDNAQVKAVTVGNGSVSGV